MAELDLPFSLIQETLKRTVSALDAAEIPFLIGGSLASWARGGPATTHDLAVIVNPEAASRARAALASAPPAPPTPRRSSACSTSSGSSTTRLQPFAEPAGDRRRRRAVELGGRCAPQQLVWRLVELVAPEAQVAGDGGGHLQRRVVGIDRARRLGEQLVGLLDGGHGLVAVLEAVEEVRQRVVAGRVVQDVDRPTRRF